MLRARRTTSGATSYAIDLRGPQESHVVDHELRRFTGDAHSKLENHRSRCTTTPDVGRTCGTVIPRTSATGSAWPGRCGGREASLAAAAGAPGSRLVSGRLICGAAAVYSASPRLTQGPRAEPPKRIRPLCREQRVVVMPSFQRLPLSHRLRDWPVGGPAGPGVAFRSPYSPPPDLEPATPMYSAPGARFSLRSTCGGLPRPKSIVGLRQRVLRRLAGRYPGSLAAAADTRRAPIPRPAGAAIVWW